jgi:hypothetical protein
LCERLLPCDARCEPKLWRLIVLVFSGHVGRHAEFFERFTGLNTRLGEVTGFRLADARGLTLAIRHLNGGIAVALLRLDLSHAVVGHIQHRHGDGVTIVREDAHHAHLAAQQSETIAKTHCFLQPHVEAFV